MKIRVADIRTVLDHLGIHFTNEGPNVSRGWVGVNCPFCDDPSDHGGFPLDGGSYKCWRCKGGAPLLALQKLAGLSPDAVKGVIRVLGGARQADDPGAAEGVKPAKAVVLPPGTGRMGPPHRRYLTRRGFDPDALERAWGLRGTGVLGEYAYRVIIPITHGGTLVSYLGRDYTGRQRLRYMPCLKENEARPHKYCLYGMDELRASSRDTVLVVEGVTDVWRLGVGAVATMGTEWTMQQAQQLVQFRKRFIMFDQGERAAQEHARRLARYVDTFGWTHGTTEVLELDRKGDPGDLSDEDAVKLMASLSM